MRPGLWTATILSAALAPLAAAAQSYPVTFGMQTAMETFFGEDGIVSFGEYDAAFVPPDGLAAEVVLADEAGNVLGRFPFHDSYRFQDKVFARIGVVGPADVQLDTPGIYNIFFLVDGEIATRLPFVLKQASDGSDPFDPEKTWTVDGFWRQLGYMTEQNSSAGPAPRFTFWTGGVDLPEGASGDGYVASLVRDGEVIAHSKRTTGHIPSGRFTRTTFELFHPHGEKETPNAEVVTLADLATQPDGELLLRIFRTSDNALIRVFHLNMAGGTLQQHQRAVLGYEPQMDFILPRVVRAGANAYELVEATWFESF
ncbi:MAG: hypothetical protein R3C69_15120 [Geminicoccaceae bacterium]